MRDARRIAIKQSGESRRIAAPRDRDRSAYAAVPAQSVCRARHFRCAHDAIYRGVLPFVLLNFVALLVTTYVSAVSTVLLGHARQQNQSLANCPAAAGVCAYTTLRLK
jgi:hypothetical protein